MTTESRSQNCHKDSAGTAAAQQISHHSDPVGYVARGIAHLLGAVVYTGWPKKKVAKFLCDNFFKF